MRVYLIERRDAAGRWLKIAEERDERAAGVRADQLAAADDEPREYRVVSVLYTVKSPSHGY